MNLNLSPVRLTLGALATCAALGASPYLGGVVLSAGAQARPAQPAAGAQARPAQPAAGAKELPPLSYVCTMPGDEDVIDDKPGNCPKCKMALVPIRLDAKWWCPVHQSLEVHDGPGKCRRDGRDLVQVTVSESWTCNDAPDTKHLEPGTCADGSPRRIKYEVRAHGDHNPRHGGQFFMATDAWHHIEGTYPQAGLFRVYFYDNFTKPLEPKGFGGSIVVRDAADKAIATVPLTPGSISNTMEARIPAAQAGLPLRISANVRFSATGKEQGFDFQFNEYSKDLPPSAALRSAAPPVARAAHDSNAAARPVRARTMVTPHAVPAVFVVPSRAGGARRADLAGRTQVISFEQNAATGSQPAAGSQAPALPQPAPGQPPDLLAGEIAPMPPALAAVLDEDVLPKTVPGLLAELRKRVGEVDTLVKAGNLSEVWLPAMGTKTVALVLADRAGSLPALKQAQATSAVSRVVTAAWLIDGYGDLGNRGKIVEAYDQLASAIADLEGAYGNAQ
jgi:hypothetical protein